MVYLEIYKYISFRPHIALAQEVEGAFGLYLSCLKPWFILFYTKFFARHFVPLGCFVRTFARRFDLAAICSACLVERTEPIQWICAWRKHHFSSITAYFLKWVWWFIEDQNGGQLNNKNFSRVETRFQNSSSTITRHFKGNCNINTLLDELLAKYRLGQFNDDCKQDDYKDIFYIRIMYSASSITSIHDHGIKMK